MPTKLEPMKTLKQLFEENKDLFYSKNPWWIDMDFANEVPKEAFSEMIFDKNTCGKTFSEQKKGLKKNTYIPHIATVVEYVIEHYKKTGERLLKDWYVRTSILTQDGDRVVVGGFASGGLLVDYCWDGYCDDGFGLSAARKLDTRTLESLEPSESLSLESAIEMVKKEGYIIYKKI